MGEGGGDKTRNEEETKTNRSRSKIVRPCNKNTYSGMVMTTLFSSMGLEDGCSVYSRFTLIMPPPTSSGQQLTGIG